VARPARFLISALACVAWLGTPAAAQGIAYTVQAIAVSEQQTAIDLSRGLLREGYPAYVVRSTGGQGDVYRVRVGAFANRAAALRYAEAMPAVGGARPVPALAEAIPQGIMPWAPRVLWQIAWMGEEVRVLRWPGEGVAIRTQARSPVQEATYTLVQAGETRTVDAWRLVPLAIAPDALGADEIDVPFVDLTLPDPASTETVVPEAEVAPEPEAEPVAVALPEAQAEVEQVAEPAAEPEAASPVEASTAEEDGGEPAEGDAGGGAGDDTPAPDASAGALDTVGPEVADVEGVPEAGLWLLRDRPMWPSTWRDESEDVRAAFLASTITLVANGTGLAPEAVAEAAYRPGGEPPPTLVVVELSDRSGRDMGLVRGVGDASQGLEPFGPPPLPATDETWWPPALVGEPIDPQVEALGPWTGEMGALETDAGFVRVHPEDGNPWRAVAGRPIWSDGRYLLLRDGDDLVLVDFVAR
jgi:hypothetical protein